MQDAAIKMADASLFIVPANGRTNLEMGFGIPYLSQATKDLGRLTTLQREKEPLSKHIRINKRYTAQIHLRAS